MISRTGRENCNLKSKQPRATSPSTSASTSTLEERICFQVVLIAIELAHMRAVEEYIYGRIESSVGAVNGATTMNSLLINKLSNNFLIPKSTLSTHFCCIRSSLFHSWPLLRSEIQMNSVDKNAEEKLSGPVQKSIKQKLFSSFNPIHLEIFNESYMHSVPKDSETHFKVVVVSDQFEGKSLIQRHRSINQTLAEELKSGVHALSIIAKTSAQWNENNTVAKSPACLGGSKHENK
jgi:stress-induced morphogen